MEEKYKYGFTTDVESEKIPAGCTLAVALSIEVGISYAFGWI
jgi:hypothetical protein